MADPLYIGRVAGGCNALGHAAPFTIMATKTRRRRVTGFFSKTTVEPRQETAFRVSYTAQSSKKRAEATLMETVYRDYMAEMPKPWTVEVPEGWLSQMPEHWRTPEKPLARIVFSALCVGALGQYSLAHLWDACREDETFRIRKERMMERLTTISVVAGLLLGAMAAFVTTTPPLPNLLNYNLRGPYILMFYSFSSTLAVIVVSSAILYALSEMKRDWFVNSFVKTRANVYCFLLLMGYPFGQIGVSTSAAAMGLLIAAWCSMDNIIRIGAVFVLIIPASLGPVYLFSLRYTRRRDEPGTRIVIELPADEKIEDDAKDEEMGEV
ncbi:hypothetical protein NM688_g6640 [Phlebia brevispora]|uniref:Uncharacterized protein n=1 Tax=Phlebia brevispora TaxID=194682 RepID=A0ACC1SDX2_9APHY|nr:hypothetical protein NM688_g6640 [Phlebia brevispora]